MSQTFGVIEKLHKEPKEVRRKVSVFIAGGLTLLIFLFWIATLGSRTDVHTQAADQEEQFRILTPLETVGESLNALIENTRENFADIGF